MPASPISRLLQQLRNTMVLARATDAHLLESFVNGSDNEALQELVRRHGSMVWGVCRRVLRNDHDAEDAFQATFLVLVRKAASIMPREMVGNWLYGVAHQTALNARRATAKRMKREKQVRQMPDPAACDKELGRDLELILDQELRGLPDKYRTVILLCDLEGKTRKEAARQLGWAEGTVAGRLARARALLAKRLTRHGLAFSGSCLAVALARTAAAASVPAPVLTLTIKSLGAVAAGQAALGAVSAKVAVLARTTVAAMFLAKLKNVWLAIVLVTAATLGGGSLMRYFAVDQQLKAKPESAISAALNPAGDAKKTQSDSTGGVRQPLLHEQEDPLPSGALARIGSSRWRHGKAIYASALSADGKRLATASKESIIVWDLASSRMEQKFHGDSSMRYAGPGLAFSADGKRLAYVQGSSFACVWDVDTGREIQRLQDMKFPRGLCQFSPDGKELFLSGWKELYVSDLEKGTPPRSLPREWVSLLSADTKTFVRVDENQQIILGQTLTGKEIARIQAPARLEGIEDGVAITPDAKTVAIVDTGKKEIQVWDPSNMKVLNSFPLPTSAWRESYKGRDYWEYRVSLSADGKMLLLGTVGGVVHRWDLSTNKELPPLAKHGGSVHGCHILPDGKSLISTCNDGLIRRWDSTTGQQLAAPEKYGPRTHAALSPDGRLIAVGDASGHLDLWEAATAKRLHTLQERGPAVTKLSFSRDGATLAVAQYAGMVDNRDHDADGLIEFWQILSGQKVGSLLTKDKQNLRHVYSLAFSPDGRWLCVSDANYETRSWDVAKGKPSWLGKVGCGAYSPAGTTLTGWWGRGLAFLDAQTGQPQRKITCDLSLREDVHTREVFAYSPDGKKIAVSVGSFGDTGAEIVLVDTATMTTKKQFHAIDPPKDAFLRRHEKSRLDALAFSRDSKSVLSAGSDAAVCVWDALTGAQLLRFLGHEGSVHTVAFGAGGRTALSCGEDGQVYIWDLRPPQAGEKRSLDELWTRLADANAYAAVWALAESKEAPDFLRAKIAPRERVPKDLLTKLLGALDSQNFQQREEATKALRELDDRTIGPLTEALRKPPSLEAQRRMESLLKALQGEPTGFQLRQLRAIQALELAASKRAREVLGEWSQGASGARLTEEARVARARLERRGR